MCQGRTGASPLSQSTKGQSQGERNFLPLPRLFISIRIISEFVIETQLGIQLPNKQLDDFGRRWKVKELALFGSVLRSDFRPDSDVDVLVQFHPDARWSLFDLVTMQNELEQIFGRKVDLVEREGLRNPFRRKAILNNLQVVFPLPDYPTI